MHKNPYFRLTEEFNSGGTNVLLASGQAVVFYRLAIMSKDGDWIVRETAEAIDRILFVLAGHRARYRPGAPLDLRWLSAGWSSHFEFTDARQRRIRCDFFSRPPRISRARVEELFQASDADDPISVVDVESLIRMKQTQRAKDYAVIGELAKLLPPEKELEFTTDPDRIIALARNYSASVERPSVRAATKGASRRKIVQLLAVELDEMRLQDRARLERHSRAAGPYLRVLTTLDREKLALPDAHSRLCDLAEEMLPTRVGLGVDDGNAE